MIDPSFSNIIKLFVFSLKNGENNAARDSFDKHYMLLSEIKYFYILINNKPSFDQPTKHKLQSYKKRITLLEPSKLI